MFHRSQRINSRDFRRVYTRGRKKFSPFFRTLSLESDFFKITVVVPKKKVKKRVMRNFYKRRTLSAFRGICSKPFSNKEIVIFLQKDISNLSFEDLKNELRRHFVDL